jgi:hypothetical protein
MPTEELSNGKLRIFRDPSLPPPPVFTPTQIATIRAIVAELLHQADARRAEDQDVAAVAAREGNHRLGELAG